MLTVSTLALFMGATLALNFAPGPDMLYVSTRSLGQGRRAGVISALGIAAGTAIHTLAIASGLAALLAALPLAYDIVRIVGAGYLIWLGIQAIRAPTSTDRRQRLEPASDWRLLRQGMITNLLNPKVVLFFLAFLPQFIDPARGSVALQILLLGTLFNLSGTLVNIGVAYLTSSVGQKFASGTRSTALFRWLTGSVFIGLGLRLALGERR